ncbi:MULTISPECIES: guanylate kinase [Pseudovibrio]|uniref:guanylate kinase n=1 Tax=Stappiaceae TaxID=2821832 RepID=UPI0023659F2C|nr:MULTISPECIES: guanylate kinase [Pseudovibrio]MDD7908908.1 guanylate kinase [Pseudovibrio exalbescens]MDX5593771.1 guanylate kinase [Pseudovibrio sp. SPO723]
MSERASGTTVSSQQAEDTRRGLMLVLSSPSGAGKSTIARMLLGEEKDLTLSVSVTTRPQRSTEVDGVDYHFVSQDKFKEMIEADQLLEWAEVHGNYYGTPRGLVENCLEKGQDVLFDIDVKGTFQLYDKMRSDVISIFILPPSIAEMEARLSKRGEDSEEVILKRMKTAVGEMSAWSKYDYIIINDDLQKAYESVRAILRAERLRRERAVGIAPHIDGMVEDLRSRIESGS